MRLGFSEIITILIVLVVIVVVARMFRAGRRPANQGSNTTARNTKYQRSGIWHRFRRVGIAFILAGAVFLFTAIGMFRWAFQSYMWSFIAVIIGFVMVWLSRNK